MDYNNQNQNSNQQSAPGQYSNQYSQQSSGQYSNQYSQQGAGQYSNPYSQQNAEQYGSQQFGPQQPHLSSQQGNYASNQAYQPQYNSPYNAPVQKPGPNACQIISLILGILSIVCCCWGIIAIIFGVVGIILAIIGNKGHKHGVGTGGFVTSIIGLVLALILFALSYFAFVSLPTSINDLNEWFEEYESY